MEHMACLTSQNNHSPCSRRLSCGCSVPIFLPPCCQGRQLRRPALRWNGSRNTAYRISGLNPPAHRCAQLSAYRQASRQRPGGRDVDVIGVVIRQGLGGRARVIDRGIGVEPRAGPDAESKVPILEDAERVG